MTLNATFSPTQQTAKQQLEPCNNTTISKGQGLDDLTTIQKCLLDTLPASICNDWVCICMSINQDIKSGVVALTHKMRKCYWWHWCQLLPTGVDLYLCGMDQSEQLFFLHVFARQTQEGAFGRGQQVQTSSIQTALCTVGKTIKLTGLPNPLHHTGTTNYHAVLAMQIESFKWTDLATKKHLAVPVEVPNYIFQTTRNSTDH